MNRFLPIRSLVGMDTITMTNGRSLQQVLETHARWTQEESTGFRCVLDRETLNEAQLKGVGLRRAIVKGSTFLDADLSGVDLSQANIDNADFQRATLTGADFNGAQISETEFSFCWLTEAIFSDAKLRATGFRRASIRNGRFQGVSIEGCKLMGSMLNMASFHHARIVLLR